MKLRLDRIESAQREVVSEMNDLSGEMERKFDKMDSKIDHALYGIITGLVGLVLKGGFDYYQSHKR